MGFFNVVWFIKRILIPYIFTAALVFGWLFSIDREYKSGVKAARDCIGFMADSDGFDGDRQSEMVKDGDYAEIQGWIDDCADIRNIGTYRRIYK